MIQRIQTLFLLIVTALGVLACCLPIMGFATATNEPLAQLYALGVREPNADGQLVFTHYTYGLFAISVVVPLLALLAIFLFKHRLLQIRLLVVDAILMIGYYLLLAWAGYSAYHLNEVCKSVSYFIPSVFMLVNLVLTFMAIHRIKKDEALVRSLDRLR
ncbi:MAG: DUF4293 domain-containing protein [Bacteroidales bacterium]|nr:DUF4293 domain-containing protein [Bacteroidales bacterium]